jgi:hypothetical protein
MSELQMDRVTAQALTELRRTDAGITVLGWIAALENDRKERLAAHRGIMNIPDLWHDQGFIAGIRAVAHLFDHAENLVATEDEHTDVAIPLPTYQGATPLDPRR